MQAQPLGQEGPPEEGMATTPGLLPGESHGQRSLAGCSPWGRKESDTTKVTKRASRQEVKTGGKAMRWQRQRL